MGLTGNIIRNSNIMTTNPCTQHELLKQTTLIARRAIGSFMVTLRN